MLNGLFTTPAYLVRTEKSRIRSLRLGVCLILIAMPLATATADFTVTGNVEPADPANWTSTTDGYIGNTDDGTLRVDLGSDLLSGRGYIAYSSGTTGQVTVDGMGSTWTNNDRLDVGYYGNGTLNISNKGVVSARSCTIGANSAGKVKVDGAGSRLACTFGLTVGNNGRGVLDITNGGVVSNDNGYISGYSTSTSEVTVNGSGSTWNNRGNLLIGTYGSATLNITDGGTVDVDDDCTIGYYSKSTSKVEVDGADSVFNLNGNLNVGRDGRGNLNISDGGLVRVAGTLSIDYDTDNDAFIDMGDGGMLAIAGNAGSSMTNFMNLIGGTDAIRYWNESALLWENISGATAGDDYTLTYQNDGDLAGYTLLTVLTDIPLLGDANLDDSVDVGDLGILAANYGSNGAVTWAQGDFNFDGVVDVGDLGILAGHYGETEVTLVPESSASATYVPEPASLILMMLAGIGIVRRR